MEYIKVRKEIINNIKKAINVLSKKNIIKSYHKTLCNKKIFYPRSYINKLIVEIEEYKKDNEYLSFNDSYDKNDHIIFGFSKLKKVLDAYVINDVFDYDRTVLITGVMHGFEGAYPHDGKSIYNALNKVACYYSNKVDMLDKTRIIIIPCCNPDGMIDGVSGKEFGRKTADGVDINRDFDRVSADETRAVTSIMKKYKPDIYIDIHGWLNSLYGDLDVLEPFYNNCLIERKYPNQYGHGKGYAISYAKNKFKSKCALVEFNSPDEISHKKVVMALNELLKINFGDNFIDEQTRKITKGYCDIVRHDKTFVKKLIGRK